MSENGGPAGFAKYFGKINSTTGRWDGGSLMGNLALAEYVLSEYEKAKSLIQAKEKKVDARMQKLETEQEVINTELESLKKVRDDNISKTFKIFA